MMKFSKFDFKKLLSHLLDLLFTNRCRLCNRVCDLRDELCESCNTTLPVINGEICYYCGVEKKLCSCNEKAMFYLSVCAPYYYEEGPRQATLLLKYRPNMKTVDRLARDMANCVRKRYEGIDFDAICYVPIHKNDLQKRKHNQSELLAKRLGELLDIHVAPILEKTYETEPQHMLSEIERSGNLLGAFEINAYYQDSIQDARILLCDDIKTTGATLDECAKTLLVGGCAEVRCITACISSYKEDKKQKSTNL